MNLQSVNLMNGLMICCFQSIPLYSWSSGVLTCLYRHLCQANFEKSKQVGGCLLLLQVNKCNKFFIFILCYFYIYLSWLLIVVCFLYIKLWLWEHLHLGRPRIKSTLVISIHVLEVDIQLLLEYNMLLNI